MHTPYELFGTEVGPGWHPIIKPLIEWCNAENVTIMQIKEKFGTLRFYVGGESDELRDAIREAERRSATTCEECGAAGVLRSGGWLRTLCDAHSEGRPEAKFEWPKL